MVDKKKIDKAKSIISKSLREEIVEDIGISKEDIEKLIKKNQDEKMESKIKELESKIQQIESQLKAVETKVDELESKI